MTAAISESWHLLPSGAGESAFNMACDETLLESVGHSGRPVLRFYGWMEPAATFGYFQKYAEVADLTSLRPLIRRPTAGGVVPHDVDWTYSLVFPPGHRWHRLRAVESYRLLHEWLQRAFTRLGVATHLSPVCHKEVPGQCFAGAERFDLLWHQRKIAGAAQRRNRLGLLIQGSVQPPPHLARADWEQAVCDTAQEQWGVAWGPLEPQAALQKRASELARAKYSQRAYNERR